MNRASETTYHIYAGDRVLYYNLRQEEFEEKWQLLNVMVGLLKTDYTEKDLSYSIAAPQVGVGGPNRVSSTLPTDEDSY
jgi:hypothetical protein